MSEAREGLDKILHQVRQMLDLAERESTPEHEAANARMVAERLMRKYRIEEEHLIAEDAPNATAPIYRAFKFFDPSSAFVSDYISIVSLAARHAGIMCAYGVGNGMIHAVGYEADISYAEMLATSARLVMRRHLEPEVDRSLSDEDNVYNLRSAGIERPRISEMLWGHRRWSVKVTNLYKRACERRGESPKVVGKDVSAKDYRAAYARGFIERFSARLRETRDATDRVGGVLELHGRKERVEEAYFARYPEHRPKPLSEEEKAKAAKRKPKKWTAADERAYQKRYLSKSARLGERTGNAAAEEVEMRATTPRKHKLDEGMETWSDRAWSELEA